jgi:hypothetical protein
MTSTWLAASASGWRWGGKYCYTLLNEGRHSELVEESRVLTLGYYSNISTRDSSTNSERRSFISRGYVLLLTRLLINYRQFLGAECGVFQAAE